MPPATRIRAFLSVFVGLFLLALALVVAGEFSDAGWIKSALRISEGIGRLTFLVTAVTFILVEGVPMLASWIRRQEINQAREEGRVAGRAEGHAEGRSLEREAWQNWKRELDEWEECRAAAERDNRPFTKQRPAPPDT